MARSRYAGIWLRPQRWRPTDAHWSSTYAPSIRRPTPWQTHYRSPLPTIRVAATSRAPSTAPVCRTPHWCRFSSAPLSWASAVDDTCSPDAPSCVTPCKNYICIQNVRYHNTNLMYYRLMIIGPANVQLFQPNKRIFYQSYRGAYYCDH